MDYKRGLPHPKFQNNQILQDKVILQTSLGGKSARIKIFKATLESINIYYAEGIAATVNKDKIK